MQSTIKDVDAIQLQLNIDFYLYLLEVNLHLQHLMLLQGADNSTVGWDTLEKYLRIFLVEDHEDGPHQRGIGATILNWGQHYQNWLSTIKHELLMKFHPDVYGKKKLFVI